MTARAYEGPDGIRRFRNELSAWIEEHDTWFARPASGASLAEEVARTRANQQRLWEAGWLRHGWPTSVGGRGGSPLLRAAVAEAAVESDLCYDTVFAMTEVLGPTVVVAAPRLAADLAIPFLRGDEGWCQGFSEPGAGSDLASLRCRAIDDGDHWVVTGQKVWTSHAQFASRMVLLARTGSAESRHRSITAMLVDMESPGVTVRPLRAMNEVDEFSETFFDDVRVPKERLIGEVNGGWSVAMSILRGERGAIFWMLATRLLAELQKLIGEADLGPADDEALGSAFTAIAGLRARSWTTQHRTAAGAMEIQETSIDKILMASAEQELFDLVRTALGGVLELCDDDSSTAWRRAYLYSRAASIYGGTVEIQRNILADQLLGLRGLRGP